MRASRHFVPASVKPHPQHRRCFARRLGFNGLDRLRCDGAWGARRVGAAAAKLSATCSPAGCDVILFSNDPEADVEALRDGARSAAACTEERVDDAVPAGARPSRPRSDCTERRRLSIRQVRAAAKPTAIVADRITARAPTLVKDVQKLLPLDPARAPSAARHHARHRHAVHAAAAALCSAEDAGGARASK